MRFRPVLAALAAASAFAAAPAGAQIMSLNHMVTDGLPHHECMRRAADTILNIGYRSIGATSEAQWGKSQDDLYTAAVYCLRTRDVAVFVVNGPARDVTSATISRLLNAWRNTP
ncbi:MAG: hypothetical protein U1F37_12875 [Alphaproteobacteria bacterium]|nr:hypothetical protein [Candidatus Odyssella sp.]